MPPSHPSTTTSDDDASHITSTSSSTTTTTTSPPRSDSDLTSDTMLSVVPDDPAFALDLSLKPRPMVGAYSNDRALEDLPVVKHALNLFLASHMLESEQYLLGCDANKERLYTGSGYGLIECVKALMSYEDEDLLAAINHTRHGNALAQQHRKSHSLAGRFAGFVLSHSTYAGVNWIKSMSVVERHAELIYAETLFEKALLGIVYSGDWLAFIKEALNLRTTFNTYRDLHKFLVQADAESLSRGDGPVDTSIDADFRSGVLLGAGLSNIILSLLPSRILSVVELFGFKGDRAAGLDMLYRAGGWTPTTPGDSSTDADADASAEQQHQLREPTVSVADEGVRRAICDMALLIFHLVLSSFTSSGVSIPTAQRILAWNLRRYPNGVFFLFGSGRLSFIRAQPSTALTAYRRAVSSQVQYPNLHHVSDWEMALAHVALWELAQSLESWRRLERDATWSKACYTYGIAMCLIELGGEENVAEAAKFLDKVPSVLQRIAGKSIPVEKFIARKARKFAAQHNRLALPALEFGYFFLAIARAPRAVVRTRMLPRVEALLACLAEHADSPAGYEAGKGSGGGAGAYWDDYCLAKFLEGVCLRYLVYAEPNAIVDPADSSERDAEGGEKESIPTRAMAALQAVLDNGPKIALDHHLVYYAHFEIGRLLACMGKRADARTQFDLILSGKTLEATAAPRKGKYSLESSLIMRTHAAIEALDHDQPL